jgi:hypothetical protein
MESTVIELSRYTAGDTPSNSQWTNNISNSKKVSVGNGDVIQVKESFIDTRQSASGDIEIIEDIQWTLQFGYYIINHGINVAEMRFEGGEAPLVGQVAVDGQPYLLYGYGQDPNPVVASTTGRPVIDSFTINIPAGIYTRQFLAALITRQMQTNPTPQNIPLQNLQFSSSTLTPQYNTGSDNCISLEETLKADPKKFITSFNKPLFLAIGAENLLQPNLAGFNVYLDNSANIGTNIGYQLCSYFPFLKDATYANNSTNIIVTGASGGLTPPKTTTEAGFYDVPYYLTDGCMAGAGQMALEYSVDGSNKFQFTYAHTPIINKANNEITAVLLDNKVAGNINLTTPTKFFNNFSGIVFFNTFTNLSPLDVNGAPDGRNDPFFAQLGMDFYDICYSDLPSNPILNRIAFPPNYVNFGLESEIFFAKTTRNLNPIQNLANTATISIYNNDIVGNGSTYAITGGKDSNFVFNISTTTIPINFSNQPISSVNNAGHYLVELICAYSNNEYINATQNYQVKAIVGTYYLSSDSFCMTNGSDSYVYQHRGEPINLSSITVRLLNPITKQEATNIGPNSTIYIMITKEQPPPIPTPPPEKK